MKTAPAPARVLVAEGDPGARAYFECVLGAEPYDVTVVPDGEQAVELLRAGRPFDLVITGLSLPGKNGLDVICAARNWLPMTPTLLLTSSEPPPEVTDVALWFKSEVREKPILPDQLKFVVRRLLEAAR